MSELEKLERWAYLATGLLTINNLFIIRFSRAIVYYAVCMLLLGIMVFPIVKGKLYFGHPDFRTHRWFILYTVGLILVSTITVDGYDGLQFLIPNSIAMFCFAIIPAMATKEHFVPVMRTLYHTLPFMCVFFSGGVWTLNLVLIPYAILIIFIGEFSGAKKWILLVIAICVCWVSVMNVDRALLIKMLVALGIASSATFFTNIFYKWVNKVSWGLVIIPFIFVTIFAVSGFNVFEFDKYLSSARNDESGMYDDTRTNVYEEAVTSAINNNYVWFGRTLARGYDTEFILSRFKDLEYSKQTTERASEVAVLNLVTWGGLIYLLLFLIWQCHAIYMGLNKTNNRYTPMLALYVAFYWMFSWIENVQVFSMFYIYGIIIMAMCMSPEFREMDDDEFREMIHEIF